MFFQFDCLKSHIVHHKWVLDVVKVELVCNYGLATLGERFLRLWDMLET